MLKIFLFLIALATYDVAPAATLVQTVTVRGTFVDNSNNEEGFWVWRCKGAGCVPNVLVATLVPGDIDFADTISGDRGSQTYVYGVSSFNLFGESRKTVATYTSPSCYRWYSRCRYQ